MNGNMNDNETNLKQERWMAQVRNTNKKGGRIRNTEKAKDDTNQRHVPGGQDGMNLEQQINEEEMVYMHFEHTKKKG